MKRLFFKVFNGYEQGYYIYFKCYGENTSEIPEHVDKLNMAFEVLWKGVYFEKGVFRVECEIINKIGSSLSDKS